MTNEEESGSSECRSTLRHSSSSGQADGRGREGRVRPSIYRGDRYRLVAELSQRRDGRPIAPALAAARSTAGDYDEPRRSLVLRVAYSAMSAMTSRTSRRRPTGVLHTFSENDLAYYRGTMGEIVAASHDRGLEVQMARRGSAEHSEARPRAVGYVPSGGVSGPRRRAPRRDRVPRKSRSIARTATGGRTRRLDAGTDYVFWDEPHWTVPEHVGVAEGSGGRAVQKRAERFGLDKSRV